METIINDFAACTSGNVTYSFSFGPVMPKTWFVFEKDRFSPKLVERCQDLNLRSFESGAVVSSTVTFSIS